MNNSIRHHYLIVECLEHFLCLTLILVNGECLYYSAKAKLGGHGSCLVCDFFSHRAPFLRVTDAGLPNQ